MIVVLSLTITGSLNIFKSGSYTQWKVGTVLITVAWAFQVFWSLFFLLPSRGSKGSPGYYSGTAVKFPEECQAFKVVANNSFYSLFRGAFVALLFVGVRVVYRIVSVFTQKRDPSPICGSLAVQVVLMLSPDVLAALMMIVVVVRTRHLRQITCVPPYQGVTT